MTNTTLPAETRMQQVPKKDQMKVSREKQASWQKVGKNLHRYVPSGTYFAKIRAGGTLTVKSLETDVRSIANLRLADLEKKLRQMVLRQDELRRGRMTFGEALALFEQRKTADATLAPNTKKYYRDLIKALLKSWPELKEMDIRKLAKHDCILWAGKFAQGVSSTAYNNAVGIMKNACEIGVEFGSRLDNPASSLKRIAIKAKPIQVPSSEQWTRFVESVGNGGGRPNRHSKPCAFFVQFLAFGGFRKSEAANVIWQDCNFDNGTISVVAADENTTTKDRNFRIKNGQFRVVPMINEMRQLLEEIKAYNAKLGRSIKPTDRIMEVSECERSMTRACREVGMARITHHHLRHLFITRCNESGVDMATISRWVGHGDGGTLAMRTYGHLRQDHSLQMAKKVSFSPKPLSPIHPTSV